jgi:hypothetical protein
MRLVAGVLVGAVVWMGVVIAVSFALRAVDPALASQLNVHATAAALGMRLGISFIGSLAGGFAASLASGERFRAPLAAGVLLLLGWGYYHVTMIWHQFPVWYHLTFFVSLPLLSAIGGRLRR